MGRTITPQGPVYPQENILRQVLGFRSVSREPVANVKDAPRVPTHKFLQGDGKACLRAGFSLKSRLAAHLGLPTMERKMLPKCSPRAQSLTANRSARHLTQQVAQRQENQSSSEVHAWRVAAVSRRQRSTPPISTTPSVGTHSPDRGASHA